MSISTAGRHQLLITTALLLIAAAAVLYASLAYDWLRGPAAAPPAPAPVLAAGPALQRARSEFRANFLDPAAHLRLAEALGRAGRPIDAFYVMYGAREFFGEEAFTRAHAQVVLYRGSHFLGESAFDPSPANEARLKARLQESPNDPDLTEYLAHIAAARGQARQAAQLLDAGLAVRPDQPGLLAYRAELASAAGDPRTAIADWARVAAVAPGTFRARAALEELGRLAQGQPSGAAVDEAQLAQDALDELRRSRPDDPQVFSTLALAIWARGDLASTRALVTEALSRRPHQAGAVMVDGALALSDHDADKAVRRFTAAWEANPDDLYSAAKLAQIYFKARADRQAALPFYLALYRANPRYDDGAPAQERIRETLDLRRESLLKYAPVEALGRFLGSDDASLRAEAAARAAAFKDPRWIEALAELLDDDVAIVRHNADFALYQIAKGTPDAVRVRRDDWLGSDRPLLRTRALNLFADLDPKGTWPLVLRALRDPVPAVRFLACTMVLDHYYRDSREALRARAEYLNRETDPAALALLARLPKASP